RRGSRWCLYGQASCAREPQVRAQAREQGLSGAAPGAARNRRPCCRQLSQIPLSFQSLECAMSGLATLLSHPSIWRGRDLSTVSLPRLPTGFPALNAELPGGGWPMAALTEILPEHEGIGEVRLLAPALAHLSTTGRWLAWIAPPYVPYAPALQAAGIDLARVV